MPVFLNLSTEVERILRERAAQLGRTLEAYLEEIANREVQGVNSGGARSPKDADEFERGLDELSEGLPALPSLPADFSRADIYGEHG